MKSPESNEHLIKRLNKELDVPEQDDIWKECKFDFRAIPTHCSNCGSSEIRYTSNEEVYNGKEYGNGFCYLCDSCGAYVGVHDTKSRIPLGRFATKELRNLKMRCHNKLDIYWKAFGFKRVDCYGYLADKLGLHLRETHFGWFDKEYLEKSIDILNHTTYSDMENYVKERNKRKEII